MMKMSFKLALDWSDDIASKYKWRILCIKCQWSKCQWFIFL